MFKYTNKVENEFNTMDTDFNSVTRVDIGLHKQIFKSKIII